MTTVYRFGRYNIEKDKVEWSHRRATKEAVAFWLGPNHAIDEASAEEVDDSELGADYEGMTAIRPAKGFFA